MKALVKAEAKEGLTLQNVPLPYIKESEVKIKVKKSAICGTDIHIYMWDAWAKKTIPIPMVIGHECMGEIVEVGSQVKDLSPGDRVSLEGHVSCGSCIACKKGKRHLCMHQQGIGIHRPGIFSEFVAIPSENIFKIPSFVPDDIASIFDPFGNAVHAALSFPLVAEDVLITGAGPIGCMAAHIAKKAGARMCVVTDIHAERLKLAERMGATHVIDVSKTSLEETLKKLGLEIGFTVGLEMSGSPLALNDMLKAMRPGGRIALLGIQPEGSIIDWDLVIFKLLTLKGIYGRKVFTTWYQMVNLLESGLKIEPVITHKFPIDAYEEAFHLMREGTSGKIILDWS